MTATPCDDMFRNSSMKPLLAPLLGIALASLLVACAGPQPPSKPRPAASVGGSRESTSSKKIDETAANTPHTNPVPNNPPAPGGVVRTGPVPGMPGRHGGSAQEVCRVTRPRDETAAARGRNLAGASRRLCRLLIARGGNDRRLSRRLDEIEGAVTSEPREPKRSRLHFSREWGQNADYAEFKYPPRKQPRVL